MEIRIYGVEIDCPVYIDDMTEEQLRNEGERLGIVYSLDNFFSKLNAEQIDTENYFYRAIQGK